jgi:hypothetical protein
VDGGSKVLYIALALWAAVATIVLLPTCISLRQISLTSTNNLPSVLLSFYFLLLDNSISSHVAFLSSLHLSSFRLLVTTSSLVTMAIDKPSDRLFRYPPMERQDLNQSQLGSFKFTPVDNVSSLQAMATSYMNSQISAYLARAKATSSSERPSHPSTGIVDADFFNKHIKPDLGDSRLRLGPAAVRSAVEGAATSPTRQEHMLSDQTNSDRVNADCLGATAASPFHIQGRTPLVRLPSSIFTLLLVDLSI